MIERALIPLRITNSALRLLIVGEEAPWFELVGLESDAYTTNGALLFTDVKPEIPAVTFSTYIDERQEFWGKFTCGSEKEGCFNKKGIANRVFPDVVQLSALEA